jgi:hypothetical protein
MPRSTKDKQHQNTTRAHSASKSPSVRKITSTKKTSHPDEGAAEAPRRRYFGPMIDSLVALYGGLSDDELIVELSTESSLRRHAANVIDPIAQTNAYHQAMLYYLKTRRPGILKELSERADEISQAWPGNWRELQRAVMTGGWWATSLTRQFRENLREVHRGKGAKEWVDLIWPAALEILEKHEAARVASALEMVVTQELMLPSAIYKDWKIVRTSANSRGPARKVPVGGNLWLKIRQMLRHRLIEHYALPSRAVRS